MKSAFIRVQSFVSSEIAAQALADAVARNLADAVLRKNMASLAVSGGATPVRFFKALSKADIPWEKIRITLVDERWVPESSERSNARLVRCYLLTNKASKVDFTPLYRAGLMPEEVAVNPDMALREFLVSGLDVVVLGMGLDGHTASFFPGGDNLNQALDLSRPPSLVSIRARGAGEPRLTFSASALLRAQHVYLQVEGAKKLEVLERAWQPGPIEEMPIRLLLQHPESRLQVFSSTCRDHN